MTDQILTFARAGKSRSAPLRSTRSFEPHEYAALRPEQRDVLREHKTKCLCNKCGRSSGMDIEKQNGHFRS